MYEGRCFPFRLTGPEISQPNKGSPLASSSLDLGVVKFSCGVDSQNKSVVFLLTVPAVDLGVTLVCCVVCAETVEAAA